jgi:hypothetical protein
MVRSTPPTQALQQLPKKWAVGIVVALILYALLQPVANSQWDWHLPSLASLIGMEKPAEKADAKGSSKAATNSPIDKSSNDDNTRADIPDDEIAPQKKHLSPGKSGANQDERSLNNEEPVEANASAASKPSAKSDPNLKYGYLKDIGKEVYVSPAGLRYTRGSEEGHRLKHLERHLKDDPDRPGKHGVFDGDMEQVLRWIDDAFARGKRGAKGVRVRDEDGRKVYIGGRDGRRDKHPEARKLRLVLDDDRVITAFPY